MALGLLPLPCLAGATNAWSLLFGANTPCKRVKLTLGLGTNAASRAMKSSGSKNVRSLEQKASPFGHQSVTQTGRLYVGPDSFTFVFLP